MNLGDMKSRMNNLKLILTIIGIDLAWIPMLWTGFNWINLFGGIVFVLFLILEIYGDEEPKSVCDNLKDGEEF